MLDAARERFLDAARQGPGIVLGLAVGALAFLAYALAAPVVSGMKDSAEFTLVLWYWGVAHPTGYPIFTLLGHGFVRALGALGFAPAHAANLFSALWGGVAVGLVGELAYRATAGASPRWRALLSVVLSSAFGANPSWVLDAIQAEVNTYHVVLVLAGVRGTLAALDAAARGDRQGVRRAVAWLCAIAGLAAGHHATTVLVALPMAVALVRGLVAARQWEWRFVGWGLASGAAGLATYGLLPLRAGASPVTWPYWENTPPAILAHITGAQYRYLLGLWNPTPNQSFAVWYLLLPTIAAGATATWWRPSAALPASWQRAMTWAVGLSLAYNFNYGVADPSSYFLAPLALSVVALGIGCHSLRSWFTRGVVLLVLVGQVAYHVHHARSVPRDIANWNDWVRVAWSRIPDRPLFVCWSDDQHARLREWQLLLGEKSGVEVVCQDYFQSPSFKASFVARHGFDPTKGLEPPREGFFTSAPSSAKDLYLAAVTQRLNDLSPLPVIVFDPAMKTVRLMKKKGGIVP